MDHSSQTSRRGAPQNFKTLHYLIIAAVIPTFAFDIPVYAIQRNPGAILGVIMVGISAILSMYRSSLLKRAKSYAQLHEYQVLLPDQDGLERGGSNVGASVGMTDQAEKTLFALVDFVFASSLLVATVLLYAMHGRIYVRYGRTHWARQYENPALIVVKTWGSLPIIMTCLIHAYLFVHAVIQAINVPTKSASLCTRCQGSLCDKSPLPSEPLSARTSMESVAPEMAKM
ncbi:hypothetical protein EG328_006880 [Venturia inaequalis]|uniref:Uncharacterized protein n=1 Tax=Venturia inaequalis TaxID=5025 RepID=A0A8H3UF18_VENIN|nr:hypothetical protein EG328_006880 [Venturia inaequalis]